MPEFLEVHVLISPSSVVRKIGITRNILKVLVVLSCILPGCQEDGTDNTGRHDVSSPTNSDATSSQTDSSTNTTNNNDTSGGTQNTPDVFTSSDETYGQTYSGGEFHLGPVDYSESQWHNACASGSGYRSEIQTVQGNMIAGLWSGIENVAALCDACILVQTDQGKSAVLRVVTYGETTPNSIDISPEAFSILDSGEYPRLMSWTLAKCPDTGPVMYEFKAEAHQWWTSFWIRNARVPITKIEISSPTHPEFTEPQREGDGSLADYAGFGEGQFIIRLTGIDGQQLTHTFDWPPNGIGGVLLTAPDNFK